MFRWLWQGHSSNTETNIEVKQIISDAIEKLQLILSKENTTLKCIFREVENAQDPIELLDAFDKINSHFRYLLRVEPSYDTYEAVRTALENFDTSTRFISHMKSALSLEDALYRYKRDVVQTLSFHLKKSKEEDTHRRNLDIELVKLYFPQATCSKEKETTIKEIRSPDRKSYKRIRTREDSSSDEYRSRGGRYADHVKVRRKNLCFDFENGKCNRGKKCKFSHA